MLGLPGYQIVERIGVGTRCIVHRAYATRERQWVIIKTLRSGTPTNEGIARLRHEHTVLGGLAHPGIVRSHGLLPHGSGLALLQEDCGGRSLKEVLATRRLDPADSVRLALTLASTLRVLHLLPLVHRRIDPANLIVTLERGLAGHAQAEQPQAEQPQAEQPSIKLTNFSAASRLAVAPPSWSPAGAALAYTAPELAGATRRSVDHRADLYALGVVLYEMLTGELPFPSQDPAELARQRLALEPMPPARMCPEVPASVSRVVMTLLAPAAEDRYQSAAALEADLATCLAQLQDAAAQVAGAPELGPGLAPDTAPNLAPEGMPDSAPDLVPDRRDRGPRLLSPHIHVGRESETAALDSAFERARAGSTELVLITGAAGIGKTQVVRAMYEPVTGQRGLFTAGRYAQRQHNTPYTALIQAFRALLRQVSAEGGRRLAQVRAGLLDAITPNGRVLGELIPELASIVGAQPPIPALPPVHRQNRLGRAFQQLIRVLARADHPLVLFLDDLQWADTASLRLIESLVMDPNRMHLLIVGAYREEEVDAIHPLSMAVANMREEGVDVQRITVPPLSRAQATQLALAILTGSQGGLRAALGPDVHALIERAVVRAQGNPRHLIHLLQSLHAAGLLWQHEDADSPWSCDPDAEEVERVLDQSLMEQLGARIHDLPEATRTVLQQAACIGDPVDLDILAAVRGQSILEAAADAAAAVDSGLLLPQNQPFELSLLLDPDAYELADAAQEANAAHPVHAADAADTEAIPRVATDDHAEAADEPDAMSMRLVYGFAHESVRQAAYATIPEDLRARIHLEIGRTRLGQVQRHASSDEIFLLVDQLDLGRELLIEQADRDELAELNLRAAQHARELGADEEALRYITVGMNLLDADHWSKVYGLSMAFHMEAMAAEMAVGHYDRVDRLADLVLHYARSASEQATIHAFQVEALVARSRMQEAMEVALHALQVLHIPLHVEHTAGLESGALLEDRHLRWAATGEATDETSGKIITGERAIAHRILAMATEALYVLGPDVVEPLLGTRLLLCKQGAGPRTLAAAAMDQAIWLCSRPKSIERGHHTGRLALDMADRFDLGETRCSITQKYHVHVAHWMTHLKESISPLRTTIQTGLDLGAPRCAGHAALGYCSHLFFLGENLEFVDGQCARYSELVGRLGLDYHASAFDLFRQLLWSLLGRSRESARLMGDLFDETAELPHLEESNNVALLFMAYFEKLFLAYLFGQPQQAVAHAREAARYAAGVTGTIWVSAHNVFHSLALLAACRELDGNDDDDAERQAMLAQVSANQVLLAHWVELAPFNFDYKHDLIEAEMARTLGAHEEAMELYDRSIRNAHEQGVVHLKALACELAAEMCAATGEAARMQEYVTEAHFEYVRWGAWAKVKDLEARYGLDGPRRHAGAAQTLRDELAADAAAGRAHRPPVSLDLAAVLHASQSISREIELHGVLRRAIEILVERTGAQRGALALVHEDELFIEATHVAGEPEAQVLQGIPVALSGDMEAGLAFSPEILLHVARTHETVVLPDAGDDERFGDTPYVAERKPRSVLCVPLLGHGDSVAGVLYLEDNEEPEAFTSGRVEIARLLGAQTATSLANARVIDDRMVEARAILEEERQQKNAELQREAWELARLNVDKDKFFSIISHDLRNPFNMMLNLVELAVDEADYMEPAEMKDLLVKLQQAAESCYNLLENLLTWSRLQSGRMAHKAAAAALYDLAQNTVSLMERTAEEKGIELHNDVGKDVRIHADRHMIDMVIRNLIGNALKFTPKGGKVMISARPAEPPPDNGAPPLIAVSVRDTGVGIPEDAVDKLFRTDVHYTTNGTANERGTGLGLTMCIEMVKQNGGDIQVESKLGQGTTFTFTVPALVESPDGMGEGVPDGVPDGGIEDAPGDAISGAPENAIGDAPGDAIADAPDTAGTDAPRGADGA